MARLGEGGRITNIAADDTARCLTLVTVVFEAEIALLKIQARSLSQFVGTDQFDQVIVIDNTHRGLRPRQRAALLEHYGIWRDKVRFIRPRDVGLNLAVPGWVQQQILKLLIHSQVRTRFYVVLDAKNHWLRPTTVANFVNPDGRARGASHTYRDHALSTTLEGVLRYLHVDPALWLDNFPVTHTPFVFETALVKQMTSEISTRSGRMFAEEFADARLTEFFLYAGWIIATFGSLTTHIDGTVVQCATVWPGRATSQDFRRTLDGVSRDNPPFLAIHRTAVARATPRASRMLARFWVERGLFANQRSAVRFLFFYKAGYLYWMSIRKLRTRASRVRQH